MMIKYDNKHIIFYYIHIIEYKHIIFYSKK